MRQRNTNAVLMLAFSENQIAVKPKMRKIEKIRIEIIIAVAAAIKTGGDIIFFR